MYRQVADKQDFNESLDFHNHSVIHWTKFLIGHLNFLYISFLQKLWKI